MTRWLPSLLALLAGCASGPELWAITHDPAAGERTGECAVSTLDAPWTEVAELHLDGAQSSVLLDGLSLLGSYEGGVLDAEHVLAETSAELVLEYRTRYQLELDAGTGTALSTRTEVRAGTTYEDCVEQVPLALLRLD